MSKPCVGWRRATQKDIGKYVCCMGWASPGKMVAVVKAGRGYRAIVKCDDGRKTAYPLSQAWVNVRTEERGLGQTTRQIMHAPEGAFYVWCNGCLDYPRDLALKLGRTDLQFLRPKELCCDAYWRGTKRDVVVDHAFFDVQQEPRVWDALERMKAYCKR